MAPPLQSGPMPPPDDSADDTASDLRAGLLALQEVARRAAAAGRFQSQTEERLLQLIVDTVGSLFGAEAG